MKKRKSNNKVLVVAIVLALVIVIGATFAWYTSKDEVTNKLSATNDYNVSITETYTPETSWTPGEEVNKDVALVNTGSVPAFVRAYLDGQFVVKALVNDDAGATLDASKHVKLGSHDPNNADLNAKTMREEAFKTEAGGYLVYSPIDTVAHVVDPGNLGGDAKRNAEIDLDTNGWVKFDAKDYAENEKTVAELINVAGLYVFARVQVAGETYTYTYDGYYYDGTENYYKVKLDTGDTVTLYTDADVKKNGADTKLSYKFYKTNEAIINTSENTVSVAYVAATNDTPDKIVVTYNAGTTTGDDATADDIIINIKLANLGNAANQWTAIDTTAADAKALTFYYNSILEGGETTADFVDSVELDSNVGNDAFYSFDYYLNVHSDSIQAIVDSDKDANTSVADATVWGTTDPVIATNAACTTTGTYDDVKDTAIAWAKP